LAVAVELNAIFCCHRVSNVLWYACVETEVLPLDRYIRAVAICNSLALLASQGTMAQFLQRIAILTQLQKYWTKGFDSVSITCSGDTSPDNEAESDGPEDDVTSIPADSSAHEPAEQSNDWETHSNSTVDLKPDISTIASDPEVSEPEAEPDTEEKVNGETVFQAFLCSSCLKF
jgi:hypothetical protein